MRKHTLRSGLLVSIILVTVISGCNPASQTPEIISTLTPKPTTTVPVAAAPTLEPTPTTIPAPITDILIDGNPDDWVGREVLKADPVGDQDSGYLDLTDGYAFVNQDALYFMLKTVDPSAPFVLFDMNFVVDGRDYQITFGPGQEYLTITEWRNGTPEFIGSMANSTAVYDSVLEVRLDLDDLGRPNKLSISNIMVMANTDTGWRAIENWENVTPPDIVEADTARIGSEESRYVNARDWHLPEPYVGDAIYTSPLIYNAFLAQSQDGTIYTTIGFVRDSGVSLIDVEKGTATPILKLPTQVIVGSPVGGPNDTLLLGVGTEVWQIHPDGSHEVWGSSPNAIPFYYTSDERLIGSTFDGRLVEMKPDGSEMVIASGFSGISDVLVTGEGVILVYDAPTGDLIRVDPNGSKRVLVYEIIPGDMVHLGMDHDGQVYFSPNGLWDLRQLDVDTGQVTIIPNSYSPCAIIRGDILFIEPGKLLLAGDQLSWADLNTGENGILVHGIAFTYATDIGPDGALYIGASGCEEQIPGQVLRFSEDGTSNVYIDNLNGLVVQIGFAPDDGLYVVTRDDGMNHLYYFAAGSQTPLEIPNAPLEEIASMAVDPVSDHLFFSSPGSKTVLEYDRNGSVSRHDFQFNEATNELKLAFGPDGSLYGLAGFGISNDDFRGPWILHLDPQDDSLSVIAELFHDATGVMCAFTVDDAGHVWVLVNPDSRLFHVEPDGNSTIFARRLPIDMPAIQLDPQGNIYFTVAAGIFRLYQELE